MPLFGRWTVCCLLSLAAGACLFPSALLAQEERPAPTVSPGEGDPVLRQLLVEVRQLRLALQRMTLLSTRFQMAIERIRIQQPHIDGLNRELSGLRENISAKQTELDGLVERRKSAEEELEQAAGPESTEMETNVRHLKVAAASLEREVQEYREREAKMAVQVEIAQSRLDDLDDDLAALMRELKEE
jgi:predicted  nucleic acid-binding Zn-ribbon protein